MENEKQKVVTEEEKKELEKQVRDYHRLSITESSRGQAVLVFGAIVCLSFIMSFFDLVELNSVIFISIVYLPMIFFMYKGHRWAIITLMILWTGEKMYTAYLAVENNGGVIGSLIWLYVGLSVLYKALKVENEREKTTASVSENQHYCSMCGASHNEETKFCSHCGNPTS